MDRVCYVAPYLPPPLKLSIKGGGNQGRSNWMTQQVSTQPFASSVSSPVLSIRDADNYGVCASWISFQVFGVMGGGLTLSCKSGKTICAGWDLMGLTTHRAAAESQIPFEGEATTLSPDTRNFTSRLRLYRFCILIPIGASV